VSESPQVPLAIRYDPSTFDKSSLFTMHAQQATAISCPSVLLVGRNGSWGKSMLKSLKKMGTESSFAAPRGLTSEQVKNGGYTVVLLDSTVSPGQRKQLASELIGSDASIFYTFPVENGCWWLPVLRRGQDCHGAPAFRRSEFPLELERILSESAYE
jgi:hypothetical protein